jgi:3-carboxy-cis,cis-muconate cycloisomerase
MLAFEVALAKAEAAHGVIPKAAAAAIARAAQNFKPDMAALAAGTARDGMVVPNWVDQLRRVLGEPHGTHLHFGSTSQDVLDTGLVQRLKPLLDIFDARLRKLDEMLAAMAARHGSQALTAHTRMQRALPITWADKIAAWRAPLARHRERLKELRPRLLALQFGGPVGTLEKLGGKGPAVAASMAQELGLASADCWHTARDNLAEYAGWLSLVSGALGKIGQDIALLAQNELAAVTVEGGGKSSAMHHKANPVLAEILVTLARYNAAQLSAMHDALVHEFERSGAAWTLEWMILPPMTVTTGAALSRCITLLENVTIRPA